MKRPELGREKMKKRNEKFAIVQPEKARENSSG